MSFGAQSMVPEVLAGLGRSHEPGSVEKAVSLAHHAGFGSVNVDLIFGGAGETDEDWSETLRSILALDTPPQHLSCYALTVEPGTPLASDPARHPDEDAQAARYETADSVLECCGLPVVRGVQLGPTWPRMQAQPPLLATGRVPGDRLRGTFAPRRQAVVEHQDPRALHQRGRFRTVPIGRQRGAGHKLT